MASVADLDEETILSARDAFNLYSRGESSLTGDALFTALRSCSVNPTTVEVLAKGDGNDELEIEDFMNLIAENRYNGYNSSNGKNEVLAAFEAWDVNGTGQIDAAELSHILTASGEELSSADAKLALKSAGNGSIDYRAFVDQCFKGIPTTSSGSSMGSKSKGGSKPKPKAEPVDDGFGNDGFDDDGFGNDDDDNDDFGF